jgi:peptide/nickel transport system substrate-binding protein
MFDKRSFLGLGLSALIAPALMSPAGAQAPAGRIVVAQTSDVLTLDPRLDTSPIGLNVFQNVFDQLTKIEADGSVAPLMASKWESSPDLKIWTFTLRPGQSFHDGSKVTIDDVIFTYKSIMADAKSPVRAYLTKITAMEKVGTDQLKFTLDAAWAPFPRQVSLVSIVPQAAVEKLGPEAFAKAPVGSGPFRVVRWSKDEAVELAAFETYWDGSPKVKTVIFKPVPSEASRAAALISGELDIVPGLPPTLVDRLSSAKGVTIEKVAANRMPYLGMNLENPVLADARIRRAMDMAIDRNAITAKLLRGLGVASGQLPAPVTFGYDAAIKPVAFDPEKAKALIKEAGYKGEKIVFQYPNNRVAFGEQVAQTVAGYFNAVGLNVELQGMEYAAFFPLWTQRKMSALYMSSFGPSIMDSDLIAQFFYETGPSRGYFDDKEANALSLAQRAEPDQEKRKAIFSKLWKLSLEQAPYLPLYNEVQAYGVRDTVKWKPRADERIPLKDAVVTAAK